MRVKGAPSATMRLAAMAGAYGLFLACTSIVLWGGYTVLLPQGADSAGSLAVEYFVRGAAFPLTLFAVALAAYLRPKASIGRHPLVALSLFLLVPAVTGAAGAGLLGLRGALVLCAVCLGCGSGMLFSYLQEVVASLKVYDAGIVVFAAAGISAAVYIVLDQLPRVTMMWIGFLVLVPLTVAAVLGARRLVPQVHPAFDNANMMGLLVASVVLLGAWRTVYERIKLSRLYQIIFPLTATIYLLLPLFDGTFRQGFVLLVFVVFSVTSSLMVVSCSRVARNQCVPPVLVYGAFAGTVYGAMELGSLLGWLLDATVGIGLAALSVVVSRTDRFEEACALIAASAKLSKRESEILPLALRGRTAERIASEFFISKNTVDTHLRRIYAKCAVHTRQELIDLGERTERELRERN